MSHPNPTSLIRQACEAQEVFSLDELEAYAREIRDQNDNRLASLHSQITDYLADVDSLLRGGVR